MLRKWWEERSPSTPWFAAGAVFCVLGALMAEGPEAAAVARVGVLGAIGFLVLLLAFGDRRRGHRG
jgi:hypothetical protein